MVRHVVMFKWLPHASAQDIQRVYDGLEHLRATIPIIERFVYGPDLHLDPDAYDLAVMADFSSVDDYLVYAEHPAHQHFREQILGPILSARVAVQLDVSACP